MQLGWVRSGSAIYTRENLPRFGQENKGEGAAAALAGGHGSARALAMATGHDLGPRPSGSPGSPAEVPPGRVAWSCGCWGVRGAGTQGGSGRTSRVVEGALAPGTKRPRCPRSEACSPGGAGAVSCAGSGRCRGTGWLEDDEEDEAVAGFRQPWAAPGEGGGGAAAGSEVAFFGVMPDWDEPWCPLEQGDHAVFANTGTAAAASRRKLGCTAGRRGRWLRAVHPPFPALARRSGTAGGRGEWEEKEGSSEMARRRPAFLVPDRTSCRKVALCRLLASLQ